MKLILKSLYHKRRLQYIVLILVFLMTFLSLQISSTITFKNETMQEKVDEVNGFQISYQVSASKGIKDKISSYLDRINEENSFDILSSYNVAYGSSISNTKFDEMNKDTQLYQMVGYKNDHNTNNYQVLEGKALTQLKKNELAINKIYADYLNANGIDLDQYKMYDYLGNEYKVVTIFEFPNYKQDASTILETNSIYSNTNNNYYIFANNQQMKSIYEDNLALDGTSYKQPYGFIDFQIHIKNYDVEKESLLCTLILANISELRFDDNDYIMNSNLSPLYFQMQGDNISQNIFKYLSYTLLLALIMGDFFVFYAFIKRKIEEDKEKIGVLLVNGIKQKQIIKAYLLENIFVFTVALTLMLIMNVIFYFILHLQDNLFISVFYDLSSIIILWTVLLSLLLLFLICITTIIQIKCFLKKPLTLLIKEKDLNVKKPSRVKMRFNILTFTYALRDVLSNRLKLIRVVFAICFLLTSMLVTLTSYQTLNHLYNEDSIGLKFDYKIDPINEKQYEIIQNKYAKDFSAISIETSNAFMEITGTYDYMDIMKYYNITSIVFYEDLKPFIPNIEEGVYAQPSEKCYDQACEYTPTETIISKKIKDIKNATINSKGDNSLDIDNEYISIDRASYSMWYGMYYLSLKGSTDSLINNGYVSFVPSYAEIEVGKKAELSKVSGWYPSLVNVKKGMEQEFKDYLEKENINYITYDSLVDSMNQNNEQIHTNLFTVLIVVLTMMLIMLFILILANIMEEQSYKKKQDDYMLKIGYQHSFVKKVSILRHLIYLMISFIVSIVAFYCLKELYFNVLKSMIGLYHLSTDNTNLMVGLFTIILLFIVSTIIFSKKNK